MWKRIYWGLGELRDELMAVRSLRDLRWALRTWLCARGLHWPIRWSHDATPGSWDPPMPPEPGFSCFWCGKERYPYRAWKWHLEERWARLRDRPRRRAA